MQTITATTRYDLSANWYDGPLWRLVYEGTKVIQLSAPPGEIGTIKPLIVGTEEELLAYIKDNNLEYENAS